MLMYLSRHMDSSLLVEQTSSGTMSHHLAHSGTSPFQINGEEKKPFNHTQTYKYVI